MLYDQHLHSHHSVDSEADPDENCRSALEKGLSGITFTDHFDPHPDEWSQGPYDYPAVHETISRLRSRYGDRLFVGLGIEICYQPDQMDFTLDYLARHEFDLVLLSVHWFSGKALHRVAGHGARPRGTQSYGIMAGDVFVIAPSEDHEFGRPRNLTVYNTLFTPDLIRDEFPRLRRVPGLLDLLVTEPFFRRESKFRYKLHLGPAERTEVERLLDRVIEETRARDPGFETVARGYFLELLVFLGRCFGRGRESPEDRDLAGKQHALHEAIHYIEEHFAQDLSLKDIAHQVYLSPNYFSELFKRTTGVSPWEYITGLRIDQARRLLAETDKSVTDIAFEVGIGDSSYFARVFRERQGQTPGQYRKSRK